MNSGRILIWCWSHGGGGSQFASNLAYRLAREFGREKVALSLAEADPTVDAASARGLEVRPARIVSDRHKPIASILGAPDSARIIEKQAGDCTAVIAAMNFAMLAPLSALLRKPFIYCAHDPHPHAGDYAAIGQRLTQSWLLRRADQVVAHSNFAAKTLGMKPRIRAKLRVAPLSSVFEPRSASAREAGPVQFLFAGRMIAYKGLGLLADAVRRLPRDASWRLTVAGVGPDLNVDMAARLRSPNVDVRNEMLSEPDLAALYRSCDVVVAPYLEASQSGVVAEALAAGKPCIVTPVGALCEQIAEARAGWILKAVSASDLAGQMTELIQGRTLIEAKARGAAEIAMEAWRDDSWNWLRRFLD